MITDNQIEGLLPCKERHVNGDVFLYYEITSKQNLLNLYEGRKLTMKQLKNIFIHLKMVQEKLSKFLLNERNLVLQPEYIYADAETEHLYFLYYPFETEDNYIVSFLEYLEEIQIYHGIPKNQVDCAWIAQQLRKEFPDMTWVYARISGSRLLLEIRENQTYQKTDPTDSLNIPCDLLAEKSGRIVSMVTRKGIPLKKPGDTCEKGEVLVSGQIPVTNDSQELIRYAYTQADADISIAYPLAYYQEFPMTFQKPVPTGNTQTGYLLQAGSYCFSLKKSPKWKQSETITRLHQLRLTENFFLQFFYGTITDYETTTKTFRFSKTAARQKAQKHLELLFETLSEKGVQISANHVRIELNESSCTAKGTLLVVETNTAVTPVEITEQATERNNSIDE